MTSDSLTVYVRARLQDEKAACRRGYQLRVAKKTGFSPAHVSTVVNGKRGVGLEFAQAIARFWGISFDELDRLAHDPTSQGKPTMKPLQPLDWDAMRADPAAMASVFLRTVSEWDENPGSSDLRCRVMLLTGAMTATVHSLMEENRALKERQA